MSVYNLWFMGCANRYYHCWNALLVSFVQIERVLQTYTLDEVLELNELTEADALYFMTEQKFVTLPNPKPLDFDD